MKLISVKDSFIVVLDRDEAKSLEYTLNSLEYKSHEHITASDLGGELAKRLAKI